MDVGNISVMLNKLRSRLDELFERLSIEAKEKRIKEIDEEMNGDFCWGNIDKSTALLKEKSNLKKTTDRYATVSLNLHDALSLLQNLQQEDVDEELCNMLENSLKEIEETLVHLEDETLFKGKYDDCNGFLAINAGAGGTESCDWVEMLYRMYGRWVDKKGWKFREVDRVQGESAGLRKIVLYIEGENVYGQLKQERGIHRLVRKSPFDANNRRHTTFAAVYAMPEIEEEEQQAISPDQLEITMSRSSGAGGQHVNTKDTAVRIKHLPTGIMVQSQQERSQAQNKEIAMKFLQARLGEKLRVEREDLLNKIAGSKMDASWGNHVRSYVFDPYTLVKDLRSGHSTADVQSMMNGDLLDDFIMSVLKKERVNDE